MAVRESKFDQPTVAETGAQVADHMPQGRAWQAKSVTTSKLWTLILGIAKPFNMVQGRIEDLAREMDIRQTQELITDWETSVGLPDECIATPSTLDGRRALIEQRLSRSPIVTLAEMQAFIDDRLPDDDLTIYTWDGFFDANPSLDPADYAPDGANTKFILVVGIPQQAPFFEYDFEVPFTGAVNNEKVLCILEEIVPANVHILIAEFA